MTFQAGAKGGVKVAEKAGAKLLNIMIQYPRRALFLALGLALLAGLATSGLGFEADVVKLLPQDDEVFQRRVAMLDEIPSGTDLILEVRGSEGLSFARKVTANLQGNPRIHSATVDFPVNFFRERWLHLLPIDDLDHFTALLTASLDRILAKPTPATLREEGARVRAALKLPIKGSEGEDSRGDTNSEDSKDSDNSHDSRSIMGLSPTLTSPDGLSVFVLIQPAGSLGDYEEIRATLAEIEAIVSAADPSAHGVETTLAGRMLVTLWENDRVSQDMLWSTLIALALVILSMLVATRRMATLIIIGAPLILGILMTLGVTALTIGSLNMVSGFMVPALIGLGVDFCVHLYLAYLDALEDCDSPEDAMRAAIAGVARPCVLSALTTSAAFCALSINHFDGISQYGLVAAYGILLMLGATFLALPPLALWLARSPRRRRVRPWIRRFPRGVARGVLLVAVVGFVVAAWGARDVSFRNDFSEFVSDAPPQRDYERIGEMLGGPIDPTLLMVEGVEEARIVSEIVAEMREAQGAQKPTSFGSIFSAADLTPAPPLARREALISTIRDALNAFRETSAGLLAQHGPFSEEFDALVGVADAKSWSFEEIPLALRVRLQSRSGTKQLMFLRRGGEFSLDRDVMRWSDQLDDLSARAAGRGVSLSVLDEASIVTRMLRLMKADFSLMMGVATLVVLGIVLVALRRFVPVLLITLTLFAGVVGMLGVMGGLGMSFNLFNVVVLPSLLGIAIDNTLHLQHAYDHRGPGGLLGVLSGAGRAVFLSSLTTAIGFGAMVAAHHRGVFSLGALSLIGMGCTFFFSTVVYVAILRLREPGVDA